MAPLIQRLPLPILLLACLAFAQAWAEAGPGDPQIQLSKLKTVYLLHFAALTEWPESRDITICTHRDSRLSRYLPILEGQQASSQIVHSKLLDNDDSEGCQIHFVDAEQPVSRSMSEHAKTNHILLVGDGAGFAHSGGMLQFTLQDNKLKLLVNLSAVKAAGLKLSSKLLRMSEIVE